MIIIIIISDHLQLIIIIIINIINIMERRRSIQIQYILKSINILNSLSSRILNEIK